MNIFIFVNFCLKVLFNSFTLNGNRNKMSWKKEIIVGFEMWKRKK